MTGAPTARRGDDGIYNHPATTLSHATYFMSLGPCRKASSSAQPCARTSCPRCTAQVNASHCQTQILRIIMCVLANCSPSHYGTSATARATQGTADGQHGLRIRHIWVVSRRFRVKEAGGGCTRSSMQRTLPLTPTYRPWSTNWRAARPQSMLTRVARAHSRRPCLIHALCAQIEL